VARRSRKARPAPAPAQDGADRMRRGYARAEARNAAVRAQLRPLAPGERPRALVAAVVVAAVLGLVNLVGYVAGLEFDGGRPSPVGTVIFCAVMFGAALGMWRRNYWAVLAFEALLGLTVAAAGLAMLFASGLGGVVLCLAIVVAGGWLFWKLIRVMGRLQAPQSMG
jgi:hypothetical protein